MNTFQIRNFPRELKERLRKRARDHNRTMSDYAVSLLQESLERPDPNELLHRLRALEPVDLGVSAAELLEESRRERDSDGNRT